jgi:LPS export ABC transporter protein LptC
LVLRGLPRRTLLFWCFGILWASLACTDETTTPVASPPLLETGADAVMTGLEHYISLKGIREGLLYADTAYSWQDSASYLLVNPQLVLYTETGVERARVTAKGGWFNPATRQMLAQGSVVMIITEGNRRVESEELNYNPNGDRIWSDSLTTMTEPGRILEGVGFDSDLNFQNAVVGPGSLRNTGDKPVDGGRPAEGGRPVEGGKPE